MFILDPSIHMWATFAIIAAAIGFYVTEKLPLEITSLGVLGTMLLFFYLFPLMDGGRVMLDTRALLGGFADPALIAVLALLVVGQGLVQSGALDEVGHLIVTRGARHPGVIVYVILILALVLSAVLNNTPVVVIFIPILSALSARLGKSVSHVMLPLSYAAILGGSLTLIGSSTNLLANGAMEAATGRGLGFFDFTVPGAVLAAVGLLYIFAVAPRLLKDRASLASTYVLETGRQFLVQANVTRDSFLNGMTSTAGMFPELKDLTIRLVQRGEEQFLPPFEDIRLKPGDQLVIAATRKVLADIMKKNPGLLTGIVEESPADSPADPAAARQGGQMLAEAMVAPASRMYGRTLRQIGFHADTNCIVLGVQRRSRMFRADLNAIRLEPGDVLLVMGKRDDMMALRANRDVVLLEYSAKDIPLKHHSKRALTTFVAVIAAAATGFVPIVIAALLGCAFMIGFGCLNIRQAGRAVDRRIVLLIGAAIAMGSALSATGGAEFLAHQLVAVTADFGPLVTLSAFFLLIAGITNVLSNNATAVLFTPIAISIATTVGIDPKVFVITVVLAANCSFATPIGYQTNLLVMAPGHYKFSDFTKVGSILVVLLWITFTVFAAWYYNLA